MPEKTINEILQKLIDSYDTDNWETPSHTQDAVRFEFKLTLSKPGNLEASVIRIHWGILDNWNLYLSVDHINILVDNTSKNGPGSLLLELYKKIESKFSVKSEDFKKKAIDNLSHNLF